MTNGYPNTTVGPFVIRHCILFAPTGSVLDSPTLTGRILTLPLITNLPERGCVVLDQPQQ